MDTDDNAARTQPTQLCATRQLTRAQKIFVYLVNGLVAGVVSGMISAGIHYLVFMNDVDFGAWLFDPLPLAGDAALSIGIQQGITWLIVGPVIRRQIRLGMVAPVTRKKHSRWNSPRAKRWLHISDMLDWRGKDVLKLQIRHTVPRAVLFIALSLAVYWPISAAVLTLVVSTYRRLVPWEATVFFGVLGVVVAASSSPIVAFVAMLNAAADAPILQHPGSPTNGSCPSYDISDSLSDKKGPLAANENEATVDATVRHPAVDIDDTLTTPSVV